MNSVADEILSYLGISERLQDDELMHYGTKRHSGRYPYGSGEQPYQHGRDFKSRVDELRKSKFTYTDENGKTWTGDNAIAKSMGLTSTEFRRQVSWAKYETRLDDIKTVKSLKADGLNNTQVAAKMGINESTVRSLLNPDSEARMQRAMETVNLLRKEVDEKGMLDVGAGVENRLGIPKERLELALDYLDRMEGYPTYEGGVPQPTNKGQQTTQKVLCKPGTEHKEIYQYDRVKTIDDYVSEDRGDTFQKKFTYPESLDSKRLKVRYADELDPDGFRGVDKDGIIELRRGCKDLDLGDSRYAQVRIMVDGTHYLKGMAVYSDNMPDGVDVIFNTNKTKDTPIMGDKGTGTILKQVKDDPTNPFGSLIKDADKGGQYWYDPKTGERLSSYNPDAKLGLINKRADQGDWSDWANSIPSQFLAKQSIPLARKQLDLAKKDKLAEFDEICSITNPTIKKHLLTKFADNCDAAAVDLKAAALPGQRYHVIIPINSLKDNEVYAPNYEDGTQLALIRYPHGGRFEIPILTVNNKNKLGNSIITKQSEDGIGINHKIAEQLSGADFDGDTVMAIPTHDPAGKVKILNKKPLKELEGFEPKDLYGGKSEVDADGNVHYYRNGMEYPKMKNTQKQMGEISNLITDMTLGGATDAELARAVKHSMVVIDAEKHHLDYKASAMDNNIAELRNKYQIGVDKNGNLKTGGASSILSRSKGQYSVDARQGTYKINDPSKPYYDPSRPDGAKLWKQADDLYYPIRERDKKTGLLKVKTADKKWIYYDSKNKEEYEKYNPILKRDPKTNKPVLDENGDQIFTNKDGTIKYATEKRLLKSTRMAETDDPYSLISTGKHQMEYIYADYASAMKDLGNRARMEVVSTKSIKMDPEAKKLYKNEVASLDAKINDAGINKIKMRTADRIANTEINAKTKAYAEAHPDNPKMKGEDLKKLKQQAVTRAREEVGAVSRRYRNMEITDREWEAIQKGAISEDKLTRIMNNTDIDKLRARATPKATSTPSSAQVSRMKAMAASNYSLSEIAKKLGVSTTTVSKYVKGVK